MRSEIMKLVEQWLAEIIEETQDDAAEAVAVCAYMLGYFQARKEVQEDDG